MDCRSFKSRLSWTIEATCLQNLIDNSTKLPLLTKIYQLSPTALSSGLKHGELLWVDGLVSDKRLLCKSSKSELFGHLHLVSLPVEFCEYPIEVLPEETPTLCTVKALAKDRPLHGLWLKPIHSDVPHLRDEVAVKLEGEAYRRNKTERLVFRGLSGRLYFMEHDSDSEFQVLRHPGPIDIRVAINKFSIPLHFHFLLEASEQNKDLKDYETNYEVLKMNYFTEKVEEYLPVEEVSKPCNAFSFITIQYLQCFKVDPQTGKPSSKPIYLPSFSFDTTVLLMKNCDEIVSVMGHERYKLAMQHKKYSTQTSQWMLSHTVRTEDEVQTQPWSKLKFKDTNDKSFCRIESIDIYE